MKRFWISLIIFFLSANTLAAVLYSGAAEMSNGSFISFSPAIDCIFWGTIITISGIIAIYSCKKYKPSIPNVPQVVCYPIAYIATLAVLSFIILCMGALQLLYQYSDFVHLPFWGYVSFLAISYPFFGYITSRKLKGRYIDLLWGLLIVVILCGICSVKIIKINIADEYWISQVPEGTYMPGYTMGIMGGLLGELLARINMPACALLVNYEYYYFEHMDPQEFLNGIYSIPKEIPSYLVCILPPVLFSVGWIAAIISNKKRILSSDIIHESKVE